MNDCLLLITAVIIGGLVVTGPCSALDLDGLVLFLPFEEAEPIDHSLDPADITVQGDLSLAPGKISQALEFNGDNTNKLEIAHADKLEAMEALTITAWVLSYNVGGHEGMCIASKRQAFENGDVYNLFVWTGQTIRGRVNGGGEIQSTTAIQDDEWYHIAYVFDGAENEAKLYVNGLLETSAAHPDDAVGDGGAPLWIGELDASRGFAWDGLIDELTIWSRALSEDEILASMAGISLPVESAGKLATLWGNIKQ